MGNRGRAQTSAQDRVQTTKYDQSKNGDLMFDSILWVDEDIKEALLREAQAELRKMLDEEIRLAKREPMSRLYEDLAKAFKVALDITVVSWVDDWNQEIVYTLERKRDVIITVKVPNRTLTVSDHGFLPSFNEMFKNISDQTAERMLNDVDWTTFYD